MKGDASDKFDLILLGRPALPSLETLERERRLLTPTVVAITAIGLTLAGIGFAFGVDRLPTFGIVIASLTVAQYFLYRRKLKKQLAQRRALNAESAARNS